MPKGLQGFQLGNKLGVKFQPKPPVCLVCKNCNKKFKVQPWDAKRGRKYCSTSCRSKFTMRGHKHWNWQGGISNRWDILHNSTEYKNWRMSVFERDYFKCQKCTDKISQDNPLHAHHIKPKSSYPDLVLNIDNGLTLCKKCHIKLHRGRHG